MADNKSRLSDYLSVFFMLVALFAIAAAATVYIVKPELYGISEDKPLYDPRTFNILDAREICDKRAKEQFGDAAIHLSIDKHSTRFDKPRGLFLVFYRANFPKSTGFWAKRYPGDAYIECHVNHDQKIKQFGTTKERTKPVPFQ